MTEPHGQERTMPICQVCGRSPSIAVTNSGLMPMSVAYCYECLVTGAEPLWMWLATIEVCGGPNRIREDLREEAYSWDKDHYIDWEGIIALADTVTAE